MKYKGFTNVDTYLAYEAIAEDAIFFKAQIGEPAKFIKENFISMAKLIPAFSTADVELVNWSELEGELSHEPEPYEPHDK